MPRYRVEVQQHRKGFVEVEAPTSREAAREAERIARDNVNVYGGPWETFYARAMDIEDLDEGPSALVEE